VPDAIRCTTPNSLGCVAQRAVQEARAAPHEEVRGSRFVPPRMQAFLNMPKIDPQTRAFLWHVAAKQTEDWTLAEYQTTTQLVPALAETAVPTGCSASSTSSSDLTPPSCSRPDLETSTPPAALT
jgi:hypothetical protein